MITKQEIMDFSRELSLEPNIVEKDYVLGWILAGIANDADLISKWIFKGGTCLKKCYFKNYRFSEDLDYTLTDTGHLNSSFLIDKFKKLATWLYDTTGIKISSDMIRFEIYQNNVGKTSIEGSLYYIGPLQRRNSPARIKLDLTTDEVLVTPPVLCKVHHSYSDNPLDDIKASCYSFSEIFAEKIRALSERARPRDLYDVIHLYHHIPSEIKSTSVFNILKIKCAYKTIPVPNAQLLENHPHLHELKSEWSNMLAHQLSKLPTFEQLWQELPNLFKWLGGESKKRKRINALN